MTGIFENNQNGKSNTAAGAGYTDDERLLGGNISSMRRATMHRQNASSNLLQQQGNTTLRFSSASEITDRIIESRTWFKWLPARYTSDLELGSWLFVYGSFIYMCIPLIPMCSNNKEYWPTERAVSGYSVDDDGISHNEVIMEGILVFISGFLFTIGSYCWVRASRDPSPPPYSEWMKSSSLCSGVITYCFNFYQTDELLGAWCYYFACLPFVPYMMIYVAKNPTSPALWGSFAILCIILGIFALMIRACMPAEKEDVTVQEQKPPSKLMVNLWVLACWGFYIICFLMTLLLFGYFILSCAANNMQAVIIYALFVLDMCFWTLGSAYFVAGSHMYDPSNSTSTLSKVNLSMYKNDNDYVAGTGTAVNSTLSKSLLDGRETSSERL